MRGKAGVFLILGAVMIAMITAIAAPHHPLEDLVFKGNWEEIRRQTSADSKDPVSRFLYAVSEDFVRQRDLIGILNTIGQDTGDVAHVYRWIGQLLQQNPDNAQAKFLAGTAALLSGSFEAAVNILTEVIAVNPGCQPAYAARGQAYYMAGNPKFSLADYAVAIQIDSSDYASYSNRANVRLAVGDISGALEDLNRAIALMPGSSSLYFNRGNTKSTMLNDSMAITDYTRAIEIDSSNVDAYFNRANSYNKSRQYELAIIDYRTFLARSPLSSLQQRKAANRAIGTLKLSIHSQTEPGKKAIKLIEEGFRLGNAGNKREAVQKFIEAYHTDSLIIEAPTGAATIWGVMGERDSAMTWSDRAILTDSTVAYGWEIRGYSRLLNTKGEFNLYDSAATEQAREKLWMASLVDFSKAIELEPDVELSYYYRSQIHLAFGDTTSCVTGLERFLIVAERTQKELIQKAQVQLRTLRPESD